MSNRDEEWLLQQESYQRRLATAIADGVCAYLYGADAPGASAEEPPEVSPKPSDAPVMPEETAKP